MKKIIFLIFFCSLLGACSTTNPIADTEPGVDKIKNGDVWFDDPEVLRIDRVFDKSELFCPENNKEGRLNKKQCYLPMPCYQTGARLKNIICEN